MDQSNSLRLKFRRFDNNDLSNIHALDSSVEVLRYITDGITFSKEESKRRLSILIEKYEIDDSLGVWAIEEKESGEFVGWIMLKPLDGFDHPEVGYRLLPKFWGKGYATEAASAAIDYGFNKLKLPKILAITNPENHASKNVLKKCGLKYLRTIKFFNPVPNKEVDADLFELNSSDYNPKH